MFNLFLLEIRIVLCQSTIVYEGISYDKMVCIISEKNDEICDKIDSLLKRSATIILEKEY